VAGCAATAVMVPDAEPLGDAMLGSAKYIARQILDDSHLTQVHQTLASRWERLHSVSAAINLMEQYGVALTQDEEEELAKMGEADQINALVTKMPQQSNADFQQFLLQLQLLVSTATRVRRGLEDGRSDLVEEALDDAESTGISAYILRMTVVQASNEAVTLQKEYQAFLSSCTAQMGKLTRGQEDCLSVQMKLSRAQAKLKKIAAKHINKAKKVIINFVASSESGLLSRAFHGWTDHMKHIRIENAVTAEYARKIDILKAKLLELKASQSRNGIRVMVKKAGEQDASMLSYIFSSWRKLTVDSRVDRQNEAERKKLEEMLSSTKAARVEATKKGMAKMLADIDASVVAMCYRDWIAVVTDLKREKGLAAKAEETQELFEAAVAEIKEAAKLVLEFLRGVNDKGLIQMTLEAWVRAWRGAKREARIAAATEANQAKVTAFKSRSKARGTSVAERARVMEEEAIILRIFSAWMLETRMESTLRRHHYKMEAKTQQLVGVQSMFRSFATQLESGLQSTVEASIFAGKSSKCDGDSALPKIGRMPTGFMQSLSFDDPAFQGGGSGYGISGVPVLSLAASEMPALPKAVWR